jgi:hypothetical protein
MLVMVIAAAIAAADPGTATAGAAGQGATQAAAAPSKAAARKAHQEEVICKIVQDAGIGTTRQVCATRREWSDHEFFEQQAVRERQRGFCGVGGGC